MGCAPARHTPTPAGLPTPLRQSGGLPPPHRVRAIPLPACAPPLQPGRDRRADRGDNLGDHEYVLVAVDITRCSVDSHRGRTRRALDELTVVHANYRERGCPSRPSVDVLRKVLRCRSNAWYLAMASALPC